MTTPYILMPYQQAWQSDHHQVRIAEKSRRIGFSWGSACECSLEAAEIDGCDTWYIGYNKDMAEEYIRDAVWWSRKFELAASSVEENVLQDPDTDKGILTFAIRFASGYRITALSSRPTNLRNKKGHIVIDEAAFHNDLPGLIKAAMAVLVWGNKSRVDIMSTHDGVDNHFNVLCEEVKAKKRNWGLHRVTFMEAIQAGLYKRICLMQGIPWSKKAQDAWIKEMYEHYGDDAREELDVIPARSGGVYFVRSEIEACMKGGQVVRLDLDPEFTHEEEEDRESYIDGWCEDHLLPLLNNLPPDRPHFFGEDFGRIADLTVITPGYLKENLNRKIPFIVELSKVPFENQKQILFYLVDRLPRFFAGKLDATGNGSYLAEVSQQRYGEDLIECVNLTANWYQEWLPQLKSAYEDKEIEQPKWADHLIDLGQFRRIEGQPRLPKTKVRDNSKSKVLRHGDVGVALVLAWAASKSEITLYEHQTTKKKPPSEFKEVGPRWGHGGFKNRRGGIL